MRSYSSLCICVQHAGVSCKAKKNTTASGKARGVRIARDAAVCPGSDMDVRVATHVSHATVAGLLQGAQSRLNAGLDVLKTLGVGGPRQRE